jgi:hypothetical protein
MANESPLNGNGSKYTGFPVDEYSTACIISYQVASLPPSKFSKSTDPVPSVRFLLAGFAKNDQGDEVIVRKWTKWKSISYNEKSGLSQLFKGVANLKALLTDDGEGGKLWNTTFKILVESKDGKYSEINRIKVSDKEDADVLAITYTSEFVPYKMVKAFGKDVYLEIAVNKEADGIKSYSGEQLIDNPTENG